MSHTTEIRGSGFAQAWVIHNGDWSGDVDVYWTNHEDLRSIPNGALDPPVNCVRLPGSVLRAFLVHHVADQLEEVRDLLNDLVPASRRSP